MSRRNNPAKWVLPETIDPAERRCIQIQVPDDPAHIAAFRGALLALASAYNWADDPAHKAKEVALVWREILDNSQEWGCAMQTQIRVDDICTLSWSYDDWVTFDSYDPSGCIIANIDSVVPGLIQNAIRDAIADGTIQGGTGQQSPQSPPAIGECRTYHVRLNARDRWHCPNPVQAGDTVFIDPAHIKGGWSDGSLSWYCPDGSRYLLGACDDELKTHVDGDPLNPGAYHMALVGQFNSTWFDPITNVYSVPIGTSQTELFVQANDASLDDNLGEVEFDVEVCSGGEAWCHVYDFTLNDGGFVDLNEGEGAYAAGIGWRSIKSAGSYSTIAIRATMPANVQFTGITIAGTTTLSGACVQQVAIVGAGDWFNDTNDMAANWSRSATADKLGTQILVYYGPVFEASGTLVITSLTVRGRGYNPFGGSNC